ncbi:MAG: NAD(P)-dependent oxidoreductase [Sideroxydans sp.]|nr:NAD(P)-dependent oxidoreductase [Sideroxydans sp.]
MNLQVDDCQRVLVTGGSGFIGTNLVEYFISRGAQVINLDVAQPRNPAHSNYWKRTNLLDRETLTKSICEFQPNFIFHMGARTDLDGKSLSDYAANTDGVRNLIDAIKGVSSVRRVVFASSRLVCRIGYQPANEFDYCPSTPYGESKVIGEQIVRDAADCLPCPWVIVRPTSIWGQWFDVPYKTFFLSVAKGRYVHPGNVEILKSFGFVGNTVYELQRLLDADDESIDKKTIYLADYPPINVAKMANTIQCELGASPIMAMSVGLLRVVALGGDALKLLGWRHPPLTTFRLNNLLTPMVHDLEPLKRIAGELPYSMEEGVHITAQWMKTHGELS